MASEEDAAEVQTITWEEVEGAFQYRMVIRDDTVGEITNKDVLDGARYDFSWTDRDFGHKIRYRTQYRMEVDSEWKDMNEYEYIHPPGSSVLRTVLGMTFSSDSGENFSFSEKFFRKFSLTKMMELDEEFSIIEEGG